MKIGDEVYIHGYVDEIRKDVVIIKNDGGYFGTVPEEITPTLWQTVEETVDSLLYDKVLRGYGMGNKIRDLFYPPKDEIECIKKLCADIHKEAVEFKRCIACRHYSYDTTVPGFVEYHGDCAKDHATWFGDNPNGVCPDWEE